MWVIMRLEALVYYVVLTLLYNASSSFFPNRINVSDLDVDVVGVDGDINLVWRNSAGFGITVFAVAFTARACSFFLYTFVVAIAEKI